MPARKKSRRSSKEHVGDFSPENDMYSNGRNSSYENDLFETSSSYLPFFSKTSRKKLFTNTLTWSIGTMVGIVVLVLLFWWIYRNYSNSQSFWQFQQMQGYYGSNDYMPGTGIGPVLRGGYKNRFECAPISTPTCNKPSSLFSNLVPTLVRKNQSDLNKAAFTPLYENSYSSYKN